MDIVVLQQLGSQSSKFNLLTFLISLCDKFIVKDSVEEKMLDMQKKKRELMSEAFKKRTTAEERRRQRISDLKSLMDL